MLITKLESIVLKVLLDSEELINFKEEVWRSTKTLLLSYGWY